jgi:hypothetical protein
MKNLDKYIETIKISFENNSSKNDISEQIFKMGCDFGDINRAFKESGIKFRKSNEDSWKMRLSNSLRDNPEISDLELIEILRGSVKSSDDDRAEIYYIKGFKEMCLNMIK